ncbi:MAG: hypothetical protein KDJ63_07085, partial [Nitratireductor sp.]|nr:hypothetical protein [Nitratireductor sp.]
TLGTLARTTVFETAPFDHSGTSPQGNPARQRAEAIDASVHIDSALIDQVRIRCALRRSGWQANRQDLAKEQ